VVASPLGWFTVPTPDGPFTAILGGCDADAPVLASGWVDRPELLAVEVRRALAPLKAAKDPIVRQVSSTLAADAVEAYYGGDLAAIGRIVVIQAGEGFVIRARRAMRRIPPGQTWTYARLAAEAGNPKAARAAGTACSANPAALFVPCHRVLPASGRPGAFGYGPEVKVSLLAREAALLPPIPTFTEVRYTTEQIEAILDEMRGDH